MKSNEEIIKSHVPDWVRWHEVCKEQVINAMESKSNSIISEIWTKWAELSIEDFDDYLHERLMNL